MKALTLRHPWAFAICHMGKRIENRSWEPPRSLIGQLIAIHGGVQPKAKSALSDIHRTGLELLDRFGPPVGFEALTLQQMIMPGIVAVACLSGVVRQSRDPWFDHSGCGWGLTRVRVLPEPIPCTGAQGLWDVPPGVLEKINATSEAQHILDDVLKEMLGT